MKFNLVFDKEYKTWLADIKSRIRSAQIKAALNVNKELLKLYWSISADIVVRQKSAKWGDNILLRGKSNWATSCCPNYSNSMGT